MKFVVHGKNIEVTEAIKDAVDQSLSRLDKYFTREDLEAHVVVRTYSVGQKVEVTLFVSNKYNIRQEVMHDDLYASIDMVGKKLEKQIRKINDRSKKQKTDTISEFLVAELFKEEKEVTKVTKRKEIENKPMTEEEALLQFELVGHDFFVFDDYEENITKILYKRKDGNYGVMEIK